MRPVEVAVTLLLAVWSYSKFAEYLENQQFWTLRLRLSTIEHRLIIPTLFIAWFVILVHAFLLQLLLPSLYVSLIRLICLVLPVIGFFVYVLPAYHNRRYLRLRWKAWGGPSRTGIRAELVPYIGDHQDWETLEGLMKGRDKTMHPIERFSQIFSGHALIVTDPTSLLITRATADQETNTHWAPLSDVRLGLFHPVLPGEPASLLWGRHNGFQPRCSRAIISVPRNLLSPLPTFAGGVDARGLCLACGILGRNKGLNPASLVCNLWTKGMIAAFEEYSVFWPRPAKTLRSLFRKECKHYFAFLGKTFVTVAAELALLLTDAPIEVAEDWLDARLEHQDLELNHQAHMLGAQPHELEILYRGHYAAMLVSLSAHRIGVRIRPEMLVYDAMCQSMGLAPGAWATSTDMKDRRRQEVEALGSRVTHLINAVV